MRDLVKKKDMMMPRSRSFLYYTRNTQSTGAGSRQPLVFLRCIYSLKSHMKSIQQKLSTLSFIMLYTTRDVILSLYLFPKHVYPLAAAVSGREAL
jgi:hypothetical protein